MPLTQLFLHETGVTDLSPLEGMPLAEITLPHHVTKGVDVLRRMKALAKIYGQPGGEVTDLTPLRGMPLTGLFLNESGVTDLSPLEGMQLREIYLPTRVEKGMRPTPRA